MLSPSERYILPKVEQPTNSPLPSRTKIVKGETVVQELRDLGIRVLPVLIRHANTFRPYEYQLMIEFHHVKNFNIFIQFHERFVF